MQIIEPPISRKKPTHSALWQLGFRPFFIGAASFAVISIGLWMGVYFAGLPIVANDLSPIYWHAHEMIFGYSVAVIAGFLLTAVKNWTGHNTPSGAQLGALFATWSGARLCFSLGNTGLIVAALLDLSFITALIVSLLRPILRARQWKQIIIISKLSCLAMANLWFYLDALSLLDRANDGAAPALYTAFYLIISLILTIGRRITPFFIERGVGYDITLYNNKWIDISSMLALLGFIISAVFAQQSLLAGSFALAISLINAIRLTGWYTLGIWKKSLLWSLYLSQWFICLGFLMMAISYFKGTAILLAVHTLALGGIGLATLSMMSRVSLGHTGRDIHQPSALIGIACALLIVATLLRAFVPLLFPKLYNSLIGLSALLWLMGFGLFLIFCVPVLSSPRIDGRPG